MNIYLAVYLIITLVACLSYVRVMEDYCKDLEGEKNEN